MPHPAPVAFEVDIERHTPAQLPPVARRLAETSPQRETISPVVLTARLDKAEERRIHHLQTVIDRAANFNERAREVTSQSAAHREEEQSSGQQKLQQRLSLAEERRLRMLRDRSNAAGLEVEKAKRIAQMCRGSD